MVDGVLPFQNDPRNESDNVLLSLDLSFLFYIIKNLAIISMKLCAICGEVVRTYSELAPGGSFVAFPLTVTFDFVPTFIDEHFKHAFRFGNQ